MGTPRLSPLTGFSKQSFASIRPPTAVLPRNDNAIMDFPARTCDQPIVLLAITFDPMESLTNGSFLESNQPWPSQLLESCGNQCHFPLSEIQHDADPIVTR